MLRGLLSGIGLSAVCGTVVWACGFHNYAPQPTFVDRLLQSDQVVLASADPDNPFRFKVSERLAGSGAIPDIPYLVDSTLRRRFATDADAAVLFSRNAGDGAWHRIVMVDYSSEPVVRTALKKLPVWALPNDATRFEYFASLIDHPNETIHVMALRELDLAPYDVLRNLDITVDSARLIRPLTDPALIQLQPISILLLGLTEAQGLADDFAVGLENQVRIEGSTLGAYATALIELKGAQAIERNIAPYLHDKKQPLIVREVLLQAMSLQSESGNPVLEQAIVDNVRIALSVDPQLMGAVVRNFGWQADR